jgi:maltose alpha-D-glucosyltransferase/alpha-amylase
MGYFKHKSQIPEDSDILEPWLETWYDKIKSLFVDSYLQEAGSAIFIPKEKEQIDRLLDLFLIEKAVYEADYELNNRPDWLIIPLNGLKKITDNMLVTT